MIAKYGIDMILNFEDGRPNDPKRPKFCGNCSTVGKKSMCNAFGTAYKRIHPFGVPILMHQETVNGNSERYDQYFQQLEGVVRRQHVNILSIVRGKDVNIQHQ